MSRRTAQARYIDERETSGDIAFDAALEAYLEGDDPERLLQAAGMVIDCRLPIAPEHAEAVSELTATPYEISDYSDAAHAIRRWFDQMLEPGPRH